MLVLGLLSIVQVVFLPGYLVLRALRLSRDITSTVVLSFALSLVINHLLVVGLVLLGVFRAGTLYAVFGIEMGLLCWCWRKWFGTTIGDALDAGRARLRLVVGQIPRESGHAGAIFRLFLSAAACLLMAGFAACAMYQWGDIFRQWDAVLSWNRWAIEWAANRLPLDTAEYPQLLPCNLSITYVLIQDSSIWFFAKGLMFLFCLLTLLSMYDLAGRTGQFGYVPGVLITYGLFVAMLRFRLLSSGYAEVPVAMFAFVSVYTLLLAQHAPDGKSRLKYLLVGTVCAAGAALTKQAGLFLAALYPILCWLLLSSRRRDPHAMSAITLPTLLWMAALLILLVAPWYAFKEVTIHQGTDGSMIGRLLYDVHAGRTVVERFVYAGQQLTEALSMAGIAAILLALGFALRDAVGRWLVALVVAPFVLIWAVGFSYDLRNLALAIPFIGAAAGVGVVECAQILARICRLLPSVYDSVPLLRQKQCGQKTKALLALRQAVAHAGDAPDRRGMLSRLLSLKIGVAVVLLAVLGVLCGSRVTRQDLFARQIALQRQGVMPDVNQQLYDYDNRRGIRGQIATDYIYLPWLPGLQQYYVACMADSLATFQYVYQRPDVKYALLFKPTISPEVRAYLDARSGPGSSQVVAESEYYLFFEKKESG